MYKKHYYKWCSAVGVGILLLSSPIVKAAPPSSCANPVTPTLTIDKLTFGPGIAPNKETVTLNGSHPMEESNVAGFYSASSTIGAFYTICTEISQPILPLQNPYTHEVNATTHGFSATSAHRIAQVVQAAGYNSSTGFGAGNNTVTNFVALQLSIWNALYDTDYSVTAGSFQSFTENNVGARTLANTWLATAQTIVSPTVAVYNLHNPVGQDLLMVGEIPTTCPDVDLKLSKVVDKTTVKHGETMIYTLTVTNESTTDATGVKLMDQLPSGVSYNSDDGAGSYNQTTGEWVVGSLLQGESKVLKITVTAD